MKVRPDTLLNQVREKDYFKQLDEAPATPKPEDAWVLKTTGYHFQYRTKDGTTRQLELT